MTRAALLLALVLGGAASAQTAKPDPGLQSAPDAWLQRDTADLVVLDKVNAKATPITLKVGQAADNASMSIALRACVARPPDLPKDSAAFSTSRTAGRARPAFTAGCSPTSPRCRCSSTRSMTCVLSPATDALPEFGRAALLLDMDGTLLDFAPTPMEVVVPPPLPGTLARLRDELGGALAVITGRPVEQIDALLPGVVPVVAGEHGGALRPAQRAALIRQDLPQAPPAMLAQADAFAAAHPGVLVERKARGFVLHYRLAPDAAQAVEAAVAGWVAPVAERFERLAALMAWEVRPVGADKGRAVEAVMALPAFAGRLPVFIGDDVTDEDGMAVARRMGGAGLFVPAVFGGPGAVRAWLEGCVGGWAHLPPYRRTVPPACPNDE